MHATTLASKSQVDLSKVSLVRPDFYSMYVAYFEPLSHACLWLVPWLCTSSWYLKNLQYHSYVRKFQVLSQIDAASRFCSNITISAKLNLPFLWTPTVSVIQNWRSCGNCCKLYSKVSQSPCKLPCWNTPITLVIVEGSRRLRGVRAGRTPISPVTCSTYGVS